MLTKVTANEINNSVISNSSIHDRFVLFKIMARYSQKPQNQMKQNQKQNKHDKIRMERETETSVLYA